MKYLKKFNQASEYEAFKSGDEYVTPNVSYIVNEDTVNFEPYVEPPFKMIDLGLPSGTLWADRNIGATSPEDAGLYFAWGDTVGWAAEQVPNDKMFNPDSYWDVGSESTTVTYNKYGKDKITKLELVDDSANACMGPEYRMPTYNDFVELRNNTTWSFIDISNNRKAVKMVSKSNSNYIIIPASEAFFGTLGASNRTNAGTVWMSELLPGYESARVFDFEYNRSMNIGANKARFSGIPVRGVCSK